MIKDIAYGRETYYARGIPQGCRNATKSYNDY